MIYLISDIHGDINFKGLNDYLNVATDDDLLIVLGDICLNFEKTIENEEFTKFFLSINKNVAFIDGNHENFEYLNRFPIEDWNGGKVRRLSNYVVYMQRGSIYTINKLTFFTFGGCKSSAKWKEMGLYYQGETATEQQYNFAIKNLKKSTLKTPLHCYILNNIYMAFKDTQKLNI